jgi:hypothetical protein
MILFRRRHALYKRHIDYLLASVVYLGTNNKFWSRSPSKLAAELSLDKAKLIAVFEAFPGLFRKSKQLFEGEYPYSLQARYALTEGKDEEGKDWHPPLTPEKLRLLYDFIQKSADEERAGLRSAIGYGLTAMAAVASALAAIYAASLKSPAPMPPVAQSAPAAIR